MRRWSPPYTILVGAGGFIGSILRYHLGGFIQQITKSAAFPFGTLAVNIVGCLLIGFLSQLADARGVFTAESRILIFIGILGGFTTFSAFGNETMNLLRAGENWPAFVNVGVHVIFGLGSVWIGRILAHLIWR